MATKRINRKQLDAEKRRGVTRRMLVMATGALAVGAAVTTAVKYNAWWNIPPGAGLKALSQVEYEVVQAMAEAWMPASDAAPSMSGAQANVGAFVDEVCSRLPDDQRKLLKLMLEILDETPWPLEFKRYRQLDINARARHLRAWLSSSVYYHRQGVSAVMALITMGYTTHPEVSPYFSRWFGCGYGR